MTEPEAAEGADERDRRSYELRAGSQSELRALAGAMSLVMDRCVWSRTMTHASLLRYLIEESYELVEAVETEDVSGIREELGDVLLQVVFHAEIAARTPEEDFTFNDVARSAHEKMVRRHPHVFADEQAPTVEDVRRIWSRAKAREKQARTSILDGVPAHLPALAWADKVLGRIADSDQVDVRDRDTEEQEGQAASETQPDDEAHLGERLLDIVREARQSRLDPERALREAVRRLTDRVRAAEK